MRDDDDSPGGHRDDDIPHVHDARQRSTELLRDVRTVECAHDEPARRRSVHHRDGMELRLQRRLKLRKVRLNS